MNEIIVTKPVQRRVPVDLKKLAESINSDLNSADPEVRKAARADAIKAELLNQKDEQHRDTINLDERRNRILALLESGATGQNRLEVKSRRKAITGGSDKPASQRRATSKNKGRKSRQT